MSQDFGIIFLREYLLYVTIPLSFLNGILMLEAFFSLLNSIESLFWGYIAFAIITIFGTYLTIISGFLQIRQLPATVKDFIKLFKKNSNQDFRGLSPIKTFFASTGGMIGISNVVGVVTAVQLGGPGALFWVWVAAIIGAIVKYAEIYLGFKYRIENKNGGYDGGPMYFLRHAFKRSILPTVVAALLCIYSVEVYQFSVITSSITMNWGINGYIVIAFLLIAVLWAALGGVKRIGEICSLVMPVFLLTFMGMSLWVILEERGQIFTVLGEVFLSAFTGHSAIGGFVGSSMIVTIQHGLARAAYSADIAIGYDSIIQSESNVRDPVKQAKFAMLGVFLDNIICTASIFIVLLTGVWKAAVPIQGSLLVQSALGQYFPYMNLFMPFFFIVTGYTTVIAFFCVGIKCARYLMPRFGLIFYVFYGTFGFIIFSFLPQNYALVEMSVTGAMLLIINIIGIFKLRKEIVFIPLVSSEFEFFQEIKYN